MTSDRVDGTCACGAVHYGIAGPFSAFQYCYCSRCRKATGSAHATNLFVKAENFEWLSGEDQVRRYEMPDAKYWCNGFCATCGSSVPWATRNGKAYIVPAGTLDDDPKQRPNRNIFWASRAAWYVPTSSVETFDGAPARRTTQKPRET